MKIPPCPPLLKGGTGGDFHVLLCPRRALGLFRNSARTASEGRC